MPHKQTSCTEPGAQEKNPSKGAQTYYLRMPKAWTTNITHSGHSIFHTLNPAPRRILVQNPD